MQNSNKEDKNSHLIPARMPSSSMSSPHLGMARPDKVSTASSSEGKGFSSRLSVVVLAAGGLGGTAPLAFLDVCIAGASFRLALTADVLAGAVCGLPAGTFLSPSDDAN